MAGLTLLLLVLGIRWAGGNCSLDPAGQKGRLLLLVLLVCWDLLVRAPRPKIESSDLQTALANIVLNNLWEGFCIFCNICLKIDWTRWWQMQALGSRKLS